MDARIRDVLLFVTGLAGMVHQTVVAPSSQPVLVGAFVSMMVGAPLVFRWLDRQERNGGQQ